MKVSEYLAIHFVLFPAHLFIPFQVAILLHILHVGCLVTAAASAQ
jgi:hypothetical protein